MDFTIDDDKTPPASGFQNEDDSLPTLQINPLTLMTSIPPFQPVDDDDETPKSSDMDFLRIRSTDVAVSSSNVADQQQQQVQQSNIVHMDDRSIAAWVETTTNEANSLLIERSPSLPSSLIEPATSRSRRNSNVSTLCDPQQILPETMSSMSSQQISSYSSEMQRSQSYPMIDHHNNSMPNEEENQPLKEEDDDEDMSTKFLPVPESEDSEVDKKPQEQSSKTTSVQFESRSLTTLPPEREKQSPTVSFHASVSFETRRTPPGHHRRHRRSSNTTKDKPPLLQRSKSHLVPTTHPQSNSLHAHIVHRQLKQTLSMPNGANSLMSYGATRQSSSLSDNVFLSPSTTNSSSLNRRFHAISNTNPDSHFLSIPSSVSIHSPDQHASNISDASGRSGIESSNLVTSISEAPRTGSITDENKQNKLFPLQHKHKHKLRNTSTSPTGSSTASTQSLSTSSSENAVNNVSKKLGALKLVKGAPKPSLDKRQRALDQLNGLLINQSVSARFGHSNLPRLHGTTSLGTKQVTRKITPSPFVEFCTSLQSSNALNTVARTELDLNTSPKSMTHLYSSSHDNASQVHSLPANYHHQQSPLSSQVPQVIDPFSQSCTSVRSTHSDSSVTTPLVNTNFAKHDLLASSLHFPPRASNAQQHRKRPLHHRRNLSGFAATARDRKNSLNKLSTVKLEDYQSSPQIQQQQEQLPLVRNIEAILCEHLIMINNLLLNYTCNATIQYPSQSSSFRDFIYARLNELSQQNPMNQRCSRVETKAFIDLITGFQMNRAFHYSILTDSVRDVASASNERLRLATSFSETTEDEANRDGHVASGESSTTSSPAFTRMTSTESRFDDNDEHISFAEHPLRFFRTLSHDYIADCEKTENELTKLFDLADQQHILYCLKHVDSGHTNDLLATFHRRLDALFVWYNLYYELTITVKKLSGLLRCDDCEDWPQLHFRSIATERERKAKRADADDDDSSEEISDDDSAEDEENEDKKTEESEVENDPQRTESGIGKTEDDDDTDIIPKIRWPVDEPLDPLSRLEISGPVFPNDGDTSTQTLNRTSCYRNFVYYMDKRSYQVKYDGLARTLIERVAPVLVKTRLALLQATDRRKIKIEEVLAGLSLSEFQSSNANRSGTKRTTTNTDISNNDIEDILVDTDNPVNENNTNSTNNFELTIEKWLHHVLKSCSTIKTSCTYTDDILKQNWLELHQQLGLPSLLPLYFFIVNVLLDVMNECLGLYNKPYMNSGKHEIDSLSRQQLVREAKLVLRDALAIRLYSVRMMEQFIPNGTIAHELAEFDNKTVDIYKHYKLFLSAVCVNRTYGIVDTEDMSENKTDLYYYVDEETSELIKEYYFARDLTLTLGNRTEIRSLGVEFCSLVQQILTQLKEELNETTETYYQAFADFGNTPNSNDGIYSAEVTSESEKPPYYHMSASVPADMNEQEFAVCDAATSISQQKKSEIIFRTRTFRKKFDILKQRTIRVSSLAKTLIVDFSIAAEFKCLSISDLWLQLRNHNYAQVKIDIDTSSSADFDNFYLFVPFWLSTDKNQVEKLLNIICSQQLPTDKIDSNEKRPSFLVFLPKKNSYQPTIKWTGDLLLIRPSESTQLALNSTELHCLHLVVSRSDHWNQAVEQFRFDAGSTTVHCIRRLARDEDIRSALDQLPENVHELCEQLTHLVRKLNTSWDQDSIKIFLKETVKFDERQLRTIESKLIDLILYVYNSGFELFRHLDVLITSCSSTHDNNKWHKKYVSTMNEFFCEWCKCVTRKFHNATMTTAKMAKSKVLRPKWFMPGLIFLRFFASSAHLQVLTSDEYKKLTAEILAALGAVNSSSSTTRDTSRDSPITKGEHLGQTLNSVRSNSVNLSSTASSRQRNRSSTGSHRRVESGGGHAEFPFSKLTTPLERIEKSIRKRENELEQNLRERKQIGRIFHSNMTTPSSGGHDPAISLKTRNIDFPWRRGTRIGQGGAGVAFRAINCSNGSIVCMKEIQLSSIASRSLPSTYPEKLRRIAEEIDMIMSINHPNIVRYFGIEKYKRTIYICMEYCLSTVNEFLNDIRAFQKRTRDRYAHNRRANSEVWSDTSDQEDEIGTDDVRVTTAMNVNELVRGFVKQLLHALLALHEHLIVHCDVKGDNIFIANENGRYIVKLGDFNLSHRLELESPSANASDSRSTQFGTLYFKPPEPEYVCKSDIWALGCTIIEMLTGKLPWTNVVRPPEDRVYIQNQLLAKKGPPIPDELVDQTDAYEFIQLCLTPDLETRPSARDLLNLPYPRVRTDS